MKTISVVVPTWKRTKTLALVLEALGRQARLPDEVICGVRHDDDATKKFIREWNDLPFKVHTAEVSQPGVIASMQAAVDQSTGEIVCLFDDDAEPLADWLMLAEVAFGNDPRLGIIGGRDLLQDHPADRRRERTTRKVGKITWYGRIYGNHHRGCGPPREVDILKGCNLAVRGDLIRELGFEHKLRGKGAQVHWEMALCFDIKNMGHRVLYDPALQVIHHIAPRYDNDSIHRGGFDETGFKNMRFNEAFVYISRKVPYRRARMLWEMLLGSSICPGYFRWAVIQELPIRKMLHRRKIVAAACKAAGKCNRIT